jgi:succinate dehydrogenase / fumarate reductase cytochrome b subunit
VESFNGFFSCWQIAAHTNALLTTKEVCMALDRKVGLLEGLRYKGGGPMLAWILHRVSGLAMIIFVSLHVVAAFLTQQMGSDLGITLNIIYQSLYFQLFIFFCVIFHTVNGLRIILLDIWPKLIRYQKESTWLEWFIIIPVYGLAVLIMIRRFLAG